MLKLLTIAALLVMATRLVVAAPNIVVTYGEVSIPSNFTQYYLEDGTDFGDVLAGSSKSYTYYIHNYGTTNLVVDKAATSVSGPGAAKYDFAYGIASATIAPNGSLGLTVTYTPPDNGGVHFATLNIPNSDPDTPTFILPMMARGVVNQPSPSPDIAVLVSDANSFETNYSTGKRKVKIRGIVFPNNSVDASNVLLQLIAENQGNYIPMLPPHIVAVKKLKKIKGETNNAFLPRNFTLKYTVPVGANYSNFAVRAVLLSEPDDTQQLNNVAMAHPVQVQK